MDWILALIGGLGIGSLLTTIVNHALSSKSENQKRLYQEKRESYLGMVRALYDAEIEPGPKNAKIFGLYMNIAKIFGTKEVVNAAQEVINTEPGSQSRGEALDKFYTAMSDDLRTN